MNVACHDRITLNGLVNQLGKIFNKKISPIHQPPRSGDIRHSFASIELIKKYLGYDVSVTFKDDLIQTFNHLSRYSI